MRLDLNERERKKKAFIQFLCYLLLVIGLFLILFPMYLTLVTALKSPEETSKNFFALPASLYLENFNQVIHKANFFYYIRNSLQITVCALLGISFIVPLISYSVARNMDRVYYKLIYVLFVSGAFIPFTILMVPQIKLMSMLHLMNSWGLILLYWVYSLSEGLLLTVALSRAEFQRKLKKRPTLMGQVCFIRLYGLSTR